MTRITLVTLLACALPLTPTLAQTEVSGPISIDTAWTAAGSPYILRGDVEVVRGAVLTIQAGVEVLGDPGVGLFVGGEGNADFGTLIVAGEAGQPVRFDAADRTAGRWAGLRLRPNAVAARFSPEGEYLGGSVIRFAGFGLAQAAIVMNSSVAYLEDVTLSNAGPVRVMMPHDATDRVVARRLRVMGSAAHGMHIFGGHSHIIQDCAFERNLDTGLFILGNGTIATDAPWTRVERCTFARNEPPAGEFRRAGGAAVERLGRVAINRCDFLYNVSGYEGGGLFVSAREASIVDSRFELNASASVGGGAIVRDTPVFLRDCQFIGNTTGRSGGGAAILDLSGPSVAQVHGCHFESNRAEIGGGLTIDTYAEVIEGSTFIGNQATRDGGGIRILNDARDTRIAGNRFERNASLGAGGAISVADTLRSWGLVVHGNAFVGNSADEGGAIGGVGGKLSHADPYEARFTANTFEANRARLGGAVHVSEIGSAELELSLAGGPTTPNTLVGNTAEVGAAIYNGSAQPIDATGNCWGTTLPAAIAVRIHDAADDPARGAVATDPIATACGGCRPDLDGDGELTVFDFLAFGGLFALADPAADFDGDGEFTIFDFLAFQTAFDAGCS